MVCGSCREREASGKREVREAGSVTNVQQSVRRGQRVAGECCSRSRRSPSASTQGRRSPDENSRDCNLDRRRTGTTSQAQRRACIDRASERTISARGTARMHASSAFLRCRQCTSSALAMRTGVGILPRTATSAADRVGTSQSCCSWLRQGKFDVVSLAVRARAIFGLLDAPFRNWGLANAAAATTGEAARGGWMAASQY